MKQQEVNVGRLSQIKPTVNFANEMTADPGQKWGPRTISDCQLIYVISGQATLTLASKQIKMASGECVFYGMNSPHQLVSSKSNPLTFASIHFSWDTDSPTPIHPVNGIRSCNILELNQPLQSYYVHVDGFGKVLIPHHFTFPAIENLFLQIVREYRFEEHGFESILRALLTQLLTSILRFQINGQYSSASRRKVGPALELIRKQPFIHWTTDELADRCGYHPTYFATLFNDATGTSPKQYMILERIRKAKQMLLEAKTIEEVADKLGYSSIHYFCRNFKTVTGLTPTDFKKQAIEL